MRTLYRGGEVCTSVRITSRYTYLPYGSFSLPIPTLVASASHQSCAIRPMLERVTRRIMPTYRMQSRPGKKLCCGLQNDEVRVHFLKSPIEVAQSRRPPSQNLNFKRLLYFFFFFFFFADFHATNNHYGSCRDINYLCVKVPARIT